MPIGLGTWEILALAIVVVLLFGAKRLPELGRQIGSGVRDLRRSVAEIDPREDIKRAIDPPAPGSREN